MTALHFAYGANMSQAVMRKYAPCAQALGVAELNNHRFVITADGYASVEPARAASVHGVLCLGVLQAMQASEPLVQELARVIRHGGVLWIDGLNYHGFTGWWDRTRRKLRHKPMHLRYESTRRLLEILGRAGFRRPTLHWLPLMPSRLQILQPAFESRLARRLLSALPTVGSVASHSFLIRAERDR